MPGPARPSVRDIFECAGSTPPPPAWEPPPASSWAAAPRAHVDPSAAVFTCAFPPPCPAPPVVRACGSLQALLTATRGTGPGFATLTGADLSESSQVAGGSHWGRNGSLGLPWVDTQGIFPWLSLEDLENHAKAVPAPSCLAERCRLLALLSGEIPEDPEGRKEGGW